MNKKRNGAQLYKQGSIPTVHFSLSPFLFSLLCCSFATVFAVKRIIARGAPSLLLLLDCCCCDFNFLCRRLRKFIEKFQIFFCNWWWKFAVFHSFVCVFHPFFVSPVRRISSDLIDAKSGCGYGLDSGSLGVGLTLPIAPTDIDPRVSRDASRSQRGSATLINGFS